MTGYSLPARAVKLSTFFMLMLMLIGGSVQTRADGAPASINVIEAALTDSTSLNGKVVYVDFWASWCAPCRYSFPILQSWFDKYHQQGFEVIAISVDKDHGSALKFIEDSKVSFPILFDPTGSLAKQYGLKAMPSSFIYGRDGRLVTENQGFRPDEVDSLAAAITQLLNKGKSQ